MALFCEIIEHRQRNPSDLTQLPIEFHLQDLVVIFYEVSSMFSYSFRAWELSDYGNIFILEI